MTSPTPLLQVGLPILYDGHWHLGLLEARGADCLKVHYWDPLGSWNAVVPTEDGLAGCM